MSQKDLDFARIHTRSTDPDTSFAAAGRAALFEGSHKDRIMAYVSWRPGCIPPEIARATGLSVVQIDRRAVDLARERKINRFGERAGYQCWYPEKEPLQEMPE